MHSTNAVSPSQPCPLSWSTERAADLAPHVLVVDDNMVNRRVAGCVCELLGYSYTEAEDGEEAVEAVRRTAFDVILMDIRMPGMDGVEAARAIRRLGTSSADAPIIAVTADVDPSDVARYLAAGMRAVVPKPVRLDQLIAEMEAALCAPSGDAALVAEEPRSVAPQSSARMD